MHEEVPQFSFDPARAAKLPLARRRKYQEWLWLFPPDEIVWRVPCENRHLSAVGEVVEDDLSIALRPVSVGPSSSEPGTEERMLPEWVYVAIAELQGMYSPKLWARFRTKKQFADDPVQIGFYCGYDLAQCLHALDDTPQIARGIHGREKESAARGGRVPTPPRIEEDLRKAINAQRRGTVAHFLKLTLSCSDLDYLRRLADAFNKALHHTPFYSASGRPAQRKRLGRFEALRLLIINWQVVEDDYVKKRKTRHDLHRWLVRKTKRSQRRYAVKLDATEKLCDAIGLSLRPLRK